MNKSSPPSSLATPSLIMPQKILWLFPRTSETFVHVTPAGTASTSYFLQTISGPILQALLAIPRVQGSEKYLKFSWLEEFPLANPLLLPSTSSPHQAHARPCHQLLISAQMWPFHLSHASLWPHSQSHFILFWQHTSGQFIFLYSDASIMC